MIALLIDLSIHRWLLNNALLLASLQLASMLLALNPASRHPRCKTQDAGDVNLPNDSPEGAACRYDFIIINGSHIEAMMNNGFHILISCGFWQESGK